MFEYVLEAIKNGYFNIPFYLEDKKIDFNKIKNKDDFLNLPFTIKEDLRNTSPYRRTNTDKKDIYGLYSSNGTTGKKTFYVYNKNDRNKQAEFVRKFYSALGMKAGGLGAVLGQIGSLVMGHCMMWQFEAMNMGMTLCPEPSPENIITLLNELPITDIATLPQIASLVGIKQEWAEMARKSTVERLILGGDFLSETRRQLLEEMWGAKVYNSFGMSEAFGPLGNECKEQKGFHYLDKDLYIEIISPDNGKPVKFGECGVGVYTTLWNKGFPLLRYWSGDLLKMVSEPCSCGSELPRFDYIGRMCDCVKLSCGRIVSPKEVEEITLKENILRYQIKVYENKLLFVYDEKGVEPSIKLLEKVKQLFDMKVISTEAVSVEKLNIRGIKPKYIVDYRGL